MEEKEEQDSVQWGVEGCMKTSNFKLLKRNNLRQTSAYTYVQTYVCTYVYNM